MSTTQDVQTENQVTTEDTASPGSDLSQTNLRPDTQPQSSVIGNALNVGILDTPFSVKPQDTQQDINTRPLTTIPEVSATQETKSTQAPSAEQDETLTKSPEMQYTFEGKSSFVSDMLRRPWVDGEKNRTAHVRAAFWIVKEKLEGALGGIFKSTGDDSFRISLKESTPVTFPIRELYKPSKDFFLLRPLVNMDRKTDIMLGFQKLAEAIEKPLVTVRDDAVILDPQKSETA